MPQIDGETLRAWRRSRGWDVPETARRLRRAAVDDQVPVHDALVRMIWRWERLGLKTERYELLYRGLGFDDAQASPPEAARHESRGDLDATDEARDVMDLGQYQTARQCGSAGLLCAQEAEADEGITWSVMAKTARWQVRFVEAAELARRGFEVTGRTRVRTELAYREANAIALFGDAPRARAALQRAERTAEDLDDSTSAWSFSRQRQAIFALSVCLHTGDPDSALRAAAAADAYWDAGAVKVAATWAQVRAGAAIAYLLKNSLDGAAAELAPVLELPPELRIQTVTGYLDEIGAMLAAPRFADSNLGSGLRQQITEFNASSV
jgi:hypothetical protein